MALRNLGQLGIIQGGILSNEINVATLGLLWNHFDELASFFVDIAECFKCYAPASSLDGKAAPGDLHGRYNELDMSQPMNRHAIACQIQRLVRSVIFILKNMATPIKFDEIEMGEETVLKSDGDCRSGTLLEVRPSGWQRVINPSRIQEQSWVRLSNSSGAPAEKFCPNAKVPDEPPKVRGEKWLFVNGIATELFWLHLACKKLANKYSREITGVFNRGDGILWDLIECAGERNVGGTASASSQRKLIQRTRSSRRAQAELKEQLRVALTQAGGKHYEHIVVIAHSQGCLLLRLALGELIASDSNDAVDIRRTMLERLCVFTFGNPSVDWKLDWDSDRPIIERLNNSKQSGDGADLTFLSSHVLCTEHFANETDFVAKLGVMSKPAKERSSGYDRKAVFVNSEQDWIGHVFGTQYSKHSKRRRRTRRGVLRLQ